MIKIITISVPEMSQKSVDEVHAGILSLMHSVGIDDFCVEISEEDEEKLIAELEQEESTTFGCGVGSIGFSHVYNPETGLIDAVAKDGKVVANYSMGEITTEMIEGQADRFNGESS